MVSTQSGNNPQWSGDGKKLFYVSLNSDFSVVDVSGGATFQASLPRRLFGDLILADYGVSLAADKFLFLGLPPSSGAVPPFTMVLNWTSHLKAN